MYQKISQSLFRQSKALLLLGDLLEEEYGLLLGRDTRSVANLEFSIQELIRQLAVEKTFVIRLLEHRPVREYAASLNEEDRDNLMQLFEEVDRSEQIASRHASRNAQLSLALLDQSTHHLRVLTSQVVPNAGTYGRSGGVRQALHPQAALISGRL